MTARLDEIKREITAQLKGAGSGTAKADTARSRIAGLFRKSPRKAIEQEGDIRLREVEAMRDRIRGLYGVPDNPNDIWVRGGRVMRTLSYSGLLGGVTLSALPDIAGVVGRNGYEAMLGASAPRRLIQAARQSADLAAASEWLLNARAMRLNELMNPYSKVGGFERGVAEIGRGFGWANGMIPWNTAWKSLAGALSMSGAAKAAKAVQTGTATKAQIRRLAENGIDLTMAGRIADQLDRFGDTRGRIWFSNARDWTDPDAFLAFRGLMTREMDISIITPGQDKPLFWSKEAGKFLFQFKSFAISANHRILLSGLQRADANVAAQVMIAITLGGVVSNLKADIGNWSRKEGAAFYADALDRSGLAGWIFEANALSEAATSGRLGISAVTGERLSRFQSRSQLLGLAGPNVDLGMNIMSATAAASRGELRQSDVGRVMSAVPGQNLPYLLWLSERVEEGLGEMVGAE